MPNPGRMIKVIAAGDGVGGAEGDVIVGLTIGTDPTIASGATTGLNVPKSRKAAAAIDLIDLIDLIGVAGKRRHGSLRRKMSPRH